MPSPGHEPSFKPRSALLVSALVASLALFATALAATELSRSAQARLRDRLVFESNQAVESLQHRAHDLESVLQAAGAIFTTTESVDLVRWRPLLEGMLTSNSDGMVQQIGIIRPADTLESSAKGPLVKFVEPGGGAAWAVGYDGSLLPLIERELQESASNGNARLSRVLTSEEYDGEGLASIVVRPIYIEESESDDVEYGVRATLGWAFAVIDLDVLAPSAQGRPNLSACTSDLSSGGACLQSAGHGGDCALLRELSPHQIYRDVDVFGRRWRVVLDLAADQRADRMVMSMLGGAGLLLAFVLGSLTWMFLRARARAIDLVAATQEVERARDAAQAASRAKSDFLANMSHEIRTPMTAILGYAEMVGRDEVSPAERSHCIETIRRNGDHLLAIVNDILDISKIEAGHYEVDRRLSSPVEVVRDVALLMRGRASHKGLAFTVTVSAGVPERITTDPMRLRQILVNLVGNAIKFTREGVVAMTVRPATRSESSVNAICIDVFDTGVGISEEQRRKLFNPFVQADESTTRQFGGTGLGLAISRRLAQMLGGDIRVRSEPGKGSTFSVTVASGVESGGRSQEDCELELSGLLQKLEREAATPASKPLSGKRVLLAEDGLDNQQLVSFILTKAGAKVDIVSNGAEALREIEKVGPGGYSVILMDMQMPVMDGYAATRTIRNRGDETPVLALTAHAMAGDRDKCLSAGCTDYLTKPVNRTVLIERCAALIEQAQSSVRRAA